MTDTLTRLAAAVADRYRIERELGAGGMATVYLAHDLKHDRNVALKVLRAELSAVIGAERFLVEIKTTANLQHPHILALYDSGQVDGMVFYVMPFVEGESLRDRLTREKLLPVGDAVRIATEVAGALDYAHRHGVIHRDIKPENILLHDGRAVVADFGIALAASRTEAGSRMTETGMSLGTPHYMSPEQALGERTLDARTDIYALGCVLHEMLAGEPPFSGPTAQAIIARVMSSEPEPVSNIRKTVPGQVADAILTALSKVPADRFATAAEFAAALGEGGSRRARATGATRAGGSAGSARVLWPLGFAVATAAALWGWLRPAPSPELPPSRLEIRAPRLGGAAMMQRYVDISRDGRTLVYMDQSEGTPRIVRRRLEAAESAEIEGVPGTFAAPHISPDGREFVAADLPNAQMFRYPMEGGSGKPLPRGLTWTNIFAWGGDGTLWLSPLGDRTRGIARVSPTGEVTHPFGPEAANLILQQVLPGGRFGLAVRSPVGTSFGPPFLLDLASGAPTPLFPADVVEIRYTSGLLVYLLANGTLEAARFDLRSRRTRGAPLTVAAGIAADRAGQAQVAVAENGTVAYVPAEPRSLVLVDRAGNARPAVAELHDYHYPRFSPDGRRLLVDYNGADGRDVWQVDLEAGALSRVTFDRDGHDATWGPDAGSVTYASAIRSGGDLTVYRTRPGRSGEVDSLISSPEVGYPGTWLPDGSGLLTVGASLQPGTQADIAIIRNAGRGPVEPVVATRSTEAYPALSSDGKWIAYTSDQSGASEVYIRSLGGGDPVRVSLAGGTEPMWAPTGRELFYRAPTKSGAELTVAAIRPGPEPSVSDRRRLFDVSDIEDGSPHANYDISPDGRTFAMVRQNRPNRIVVLQNLPALFRQLERGKPQ